MTVVPDSKQNFLLAALPEAELRRWLPQMECVEMSLGQVLYESGDINGHVYFPTSAVVSLFYTGDGGSTAKIAVVGREGLVGIALFIGGGSTPSRAVVQSAGQGFRMNAQTVKDDFDRGGPVMRLLLHYSLALITQMVQTAACNKQHSPDQRLCRMLLLSLDRLQCNDVVMTQELIADMLGVPGDAATQCALHLQEAGLIRYERGHRAHRQDWQGRKQRAGNRHEDGRRRLIRPRTGADRRDCAAYRASAATGR